MTTTVSTQDQLAASRMLCAQLHVALTKAREYIADDDKDEPLLMELDGALEHNEPEIHALRTDAQRAAREQQRLAEARTHGARVQSALMAVLQQLEGVPLSTAGQEAVTAAMSAVTSMDFPVAQLAVDIKALAARHNQEGDDLAEAARRVLGAFEPIKEG